MRSGQTSPKEKKMRKGGTEVRIPLKFPMQREKKKRTEGRKIKKVDFLQFSKTRHSPPPPTPPNNTKIRPHTPAPPQTPHPTPPPTPPPTQKNHKNVRAGVKTSQIHPVRLLGGEFKSGKSLAGFTGRRAPGRKQELRGEGGTKNANRTSQRQEDSL